MTPRIGFREQRYERPGMRNFNYGNRRPEFGNRGIFEHRLHHGFGQKPQSNNQSFFGKLFGNLGKTATLGFGIGTIALYEARKKGDVFGENKAAAEQTAQGNEGGTTAEGVLGGAAQGAMTGATLGSIIPGVGTAIGGAVGGLIGGIGKLFKF